MRPHPRSVFLAAALIAPAAVIVNANPAPEAVGEARDSALKHAMADALASREPC
jgi:hypothetical protein